MSIATLTAALAIFGFAALCFAAAVTDMARFEIPNRFSLTIALLYPAYLAASPTPVAWQSALLLASGVLLAGFLLFVFGTVGGGDVTRRGIGEGEPVTPNRLVKPGERGFLAAVLKAGHRAVSIPIDAASGIAGLVFPGDRVDILLTHSVPARDSEEGSDPRRASETILENVRVLAVDQAVDDLQGEPKLAKTATLEVTPKQAEILSVARQLGGLSLSLRSLAKNEAELAAAYENGGVLEEPDPEKGETYTWDADASLLVSRPAAAKGQKVVVSRGSEAVEVTFGSLGQ
jgi:Flp pilus assembly protein CpaB